MPVRTRIFVLLNGSKNNVFTLRDNGPDHRRLWLSVCLTSSVGWYRENVATANLLFLLGLLGLVIGAIFHVLQSGFLTLFLRGFADIRHLFIRQSKALQEENERLRSDESLTAWKTSVFRHLKVYTSGCGTGLVLCSIVLMGIG